MLRQLFRGWFRFYVELYAQRFHAPLILSESKILLSLPAETAHQPAMGVLAAVIALNDLLA